MRQDSSGYVNFAASVVHLTPCRLQYSSSRPRFRVVPCRLLQCGFRRALMTISYGQIATSVERCGTCCQWHTEIWSRIMHTELPWTNQVQARYAYVRCQRNKAPRYLMDHCTSVSDVAYRQRLRSASSHEVSVPRHRLSTYGRWAFAVASPTAWNSARGHAGSGGFWRQLQAVREDIFIAQY